MVPRATSGSWEHVVSGACGDLLIGKIVEVWLCHGCEGADVCLRIRIHISASETIFPEKQHISEYHLNGQLLF
eukprot:5463111-Amphidinium_carterae.1